VATRDIGQYNAYTEESWNDEVLVGDASGSPQTILERLIDEEGRQTEFVGDSGLIETAGLKRKTAADEKNDQRSLERLLQRTLYLLVRRKAREGKPENWVFPNGSLEGREGLNQVSQAVKRGIFRKHINIDYRLRKEFSKKPVDQT
jgi:large subunit ribosomal protein L46